MTHPCGHAYRQGRAACPHPATGAGARCLWHNPAVRKDDAYLRRVLGEVVAASGGDLEEAHLVGLDWPEAPLPGARLAGADLRDARLPRARLAGADLSGAVLRRADLADADLAGAVLRGADLTGTSLRGASLRGADLTGAILDATVLNGADLADADLSGAVITSFRWNQRTVLTGIKGFAAQTAASDGDETQIYPAPLTLADGDHAAPDADRTRLYARPTPETRLLRRSGVQTVNPGPPTPRRWRWVALLAVAVFASGAGALAGRALAPGAAPMAPLAAPATAPTPDDGRLAALGAERDRALATLAERDAALAALNERLAAAERAQGSAAQVRARADAEATRLAEALRESERELARLRAADDRAEVLALQADAAAQAAHAVAQQNGRDARISRVLAEGVARLSDENAALTAQRDQKLVEYQRIDALAADNARLGRELAQAAADRDRARGELRTATAELSQARDALERYLARIRASRLEEYLGDAGDRAPLLPLTPGEPVALGGDYLVTLRADPLPASGVGAVPRVGVQLTLQRPAGAPPPDVTVVLYDGEQRPLHRIALGFPQARRDTPFLTASAQIDAPRQPRFARIVLAPGLVADAH